MRELIKGSMSSLAKIGKYCSELSKKTEKANPYKIVDYFEESKTNDTIFLVQIHPTSAVLKLKPEELINDDNSLENFSVSDIRTIAYFALKDRGLFKEHSFSIQSIYQKENEYFARYRDDKGDLIESKVDDISKNESLLLKFSPIEAHMLGYVYHEESILKEAFLKKYAEKS